MATHDDRDTRDARDTPLDRAIDRVVEDMTRTDGVSIEASIARVAARVREPERVAHGWRVAWVAAVALIIVMTIAGVWRWMPRAGDDAVSPTHTAVTNVPTEAVPPASTTQRDSITQPRARVAVRPRSRDAVEAPFVSDLVPSRDDLAVTTITPAPIEVPARLAVPLLDTPALVVESIPVDPVGGPDAGPAPER